MKLIAHRGYINSKIKENTLEAFDNAIYNNFYGIECDIRVSKDKQLVIYHNAFLFKINNQLKLVSDVNYNDLKKYNIPLLKKVLSKYKCIKLIELKTSIDIESIKDYIDDNTYFMSFNSSYIFKLKHKYPNYKFGVLNYILNSKDNYDLDFICLLDSIVTDNLVYYFLRKHIEVFIYGIKDKPRYVSDLVYYIVDKKI